MKISQHPEDSNIKYVTPENKEALYLYSRSGKLLGYVSYHDDEITIYCPSKIKMSKHDKNKVEYYDKRKYNKTHVEG